MKRVRLASLVPELPKDKVDDGGLAELLGIKTDEVSAFSKGRARFFSPDGEGPADLAERAARRLFEREGLEPADVDFILFATNTPDITFPGSACFLQRALDCGTVGCLDVRSQCTGFLVALDIARRFVGTDIYRRVRGPDGQVDNVLKVHSLRPHSLHGHMTLYKSVLHHSANTLPKWFLEAIGVMVSRINGCNYCERHHAAGMQRLLAGRAAQFDDYLTALDMIRADEPFDRAQQAALVYVRKLTQTPSEPN